MKSKYIFSLFLIMFCLVSLASVSASEDFNQTIDDNVDMISTGVSEGTLGLSLDDVGNDTLTVSYDEQILAAGNRWYVNASNTAVDRNGSQTNPFNNLNETFNSPNLNDGDTIYIAGGTYTGVNNTNLEINKKLNLVNWQDDEVIFDARHLSSIFTVNVDEFNVTGITFKNGNNTTSYGGALVFSKGLKNSRIDAAFINNTAYNGGAIYSLSLVNVNINGRFINNTAANYGGAISINESSDSVNIDAEFINNSALNNGGAIYSGQSVENSNISGTFKNNTAHFGGAIYFTNSSNNKYRAYFENNSANGENSNGGAIHILKSVDDDIGGDYVANHISGTGLSLDGGAISISKLENTNISGRFINNYGQINVSSRGGAIFIGNAENFICAADFTGNVAFHGGALMFDPNNVDIINITLMSNFTDNRASKGGAVCVIGEVDNAKISGKFENNSADSKFDAGGAIYVGGYLTNSYIAGEFNNNSANNSGWGGAIYIGICENVNFTSNFNNNSAGRGAAIFTQSSANNKIISNFTNNSAKNGGAILSFEINGDVINSNFTNNHADENGGAIYALGDMQDTVINSNFTYNSAKNGSAIFVQPDYSFSGNNISGNFINNSAEQFGGAIYIIFNDNCDNNKINANFIGNNASNTAAIYMNCYSSNNEINSNFIDNSANDGAVISILGDSQDDSIFNSLFVNNTANSIIYVEKGNTKINNNIFLNNKRQYDIVSGSEKTNKLNVTDNWFGHNATNYEDGPSINGSMDCDVWLFLNATANPESIAYLETSEITFNLYEYNNKTGPTNEKYNDALLEPVNLTITSTNGDVNKKTAKFGDKLKFTPTLAGTGSVTASVEDAYDTIELEITKVDSELSAKVNPSEIDYGDNVTINLSYKENVTGTVNITLIGQKENYTVSDIPLNETITISDLIIPGEYKVNVSYSGDDNFNNATVNTKDNLIVNDIEILVDNLTKYYGGKEALNVSVVNSKGNPSANKKIEITLNGVTYKRTTDENGNASLNINLNPGKYPVTVAFKDKSAYATVTVLSTINGTDITMVYGDGTTYDVTVLDGEGNCLAEGSVVTFNVNGIINETAVHGSEGLAQWSVNLPGGEYIVTATNPLTGENTSNNITVIKADSDISVIAHNITVDNVNGIIADIVLPGDAYGNVSVTVGGNTVVYDISSSEHTSRGGKTVMFIRNNGLKAGEYNISATYEGNEYYNPSSGNANFTVFKADSDISVIAHNITADNVNGIIADIVLPGDAYGNVSVTVGGNTVVYDISSSEHTSRGGKTVMFIRNNGLKAGEYNISATYEGNEYYNPSSGNASFIVSKIDISPKIELENSTLIVSVPENVTGNMTLTVDNQTFVSPIENGTAVFDLSDIPSGDYNSTLIYPGDDIYNEFKENISVSLNNTFKILVDNLTKYYGGKEALKVSVVDNKGNPASNKTVEITLNGVTYKRTTDENGNALLNINLNPGQYPVTVKCENESADALVTVLSTINGTDITKVYGDGTTYDVTVLDGEGNCLPEGSVVTFNVNGIIKEAAVYGSEGLARWNADLPAGDYIVTATNPVTGEKSSNNITVIKADSDISVIAHNITADNVNAIIAEIVLPGDAYGNVSVTVGDNTAVYDIASSEHTSRGGKTVMFIRSNGLKAGEYNISATYEGNEYYNRSSGNDLVLISKISYEPNITVDGKKVIVEVPENATDNISLLIGDKTLVSPIKDGIAEFDLSNIPAGDYNATVAYGGDDIYEGFEKAVAVSIEGEIHVDYDNLTKYYHGPEKFAVNVTDGRGNPIAKQFVQITINGITYNRTTNENGTVYLAINLNSGEYDTAVVVNNITYDALVTVLSTIKAEDLEKVVLSDRQFYATFLDSQGNYLKNGTAVKFNINGVEYTRYVSGDKGLTKLNINLMQGDYIITSVNLVTGDKYSNNITVLPRIIENYDITKYFRNGTVFTVKIVDDDCKVAGAGIKVTYNIHGVFYTRYTGSDGIARLNINIEPGEYIITTECKGCKVSNKITVLPVLIGEDVTMKYGDGTRFVAKLLDGQGNAYPNQKLNFNVYGILTEALTDSNGIVRIPLTLQPGEYLMTSTYSGNGAVAGNKITVTG